MDADGFGAVTSALATFTDGRFMPRATVDVQDMHHVSGAGQFGGADQSGSSVESVAPNPDQLYYGARNN